MEERERYDWETEDGTGTAVVDDPHGVLSVTVDDALLTLARQVADLKLDIAAVASNAFADVSRTNERLNHIQDANLAPMLESSAVIVELRGIRSAIEALTKSIDGVQEANVYGQWCIRTMPFGGAS